MQRWSALLVAFIVGICAGVVVDRVCFPRSVANRNDRVHKETYDKIKDGTHISDVMVRLGPCELANEQWYLVDQEGRYERWTREDGHRKSQSGKLEKHDGKPIREVKQEFVWRSGDRAIFVTFENDKVIIKREQGLE